MVTERSIGAAPAATLRSARSCPAQKPRPAPVSNTTRTSDSSRARSRAAFSRWCISGLKALSLSGRLSVMRRTPLSSETRIEDIGKEYNPAVPKVYAIDGIVPVVHPSAFIPPTAVLIGDVIVGARAYIGPGACLRGDFGRIVVEEGSNIQDTCMLHGFPGKDTLVGPEVTVGHGAVLHGCVVRRGALIGMNCVVNDNAEVGEDTVVAALAFVKAEARVPARALAAGIPARVMRQLSDEEIRWKDDNTRVYQKLAVRSVSMEVVDALTTPEPNRKRIDIPGAIPLSELKKKHA